MTTATIMSGDPEADIFSPGFPVYLLLMRFAIYGVTDRAAGRFAPGNAVYSSIGAE